MSSHYSLRSRLAETQAPSLRATPNASPTISKTGAGITRKTRPPEYTLQLQRVIGTTTNGPSGLACCSDTDSYAYCAGAVAVFSQLASDGTPTHRYYKARPTAPSLNPPTSYYDSSPASTPSKRRISTITSRKRLDDYNGGSPGRDWSDENGSQTWTARERIKTVACVALSRDGRWLAVGEAGYNPRVLLFSTAEDASCETPVSIVTDHTYGLRCVAFSPDMRYLATLGDYKDGFLFIWSFNPRTGQLTLHSANKCTANICDMTFCGNSLITVGTRCIRVWGVNEAAAKQSPTRKPRYKSTDTQPSSPGPTPLAGRNVLLGSMVDCTFTCTVPIDEDNLVIGTDTGYVCLVDMAQNVLELKVLKKLDLAVSSIAFIPLPRQLLMGTSRGVQHEDFDALCRETPSALKRPRTKAPRLSIRRSMGLLQETEKSIIAIGGLRDHTVTLDNNGSLQIQSNGPPRLDEPSPTFAAHKSVILGVQALPETAGRGDFFTYSKNAEVKFWNTDGVLLRQESISLDPTESEDDSCENELTRMRYLSSHDAFIAADRFGVLKLLNSKNWEVNHTVRAHSTVISCIDIYDPASLVATCSRDRMVQLFHINGSTFSLMQTMDDHVGAVNEVLFSNEGARLLSCSADRSLVIRDRVLREEGGLSTVAYLTTKVLSLKSSPLSMAMLNESTLAVSTMDRCVTRVDVSTGTLLDSSKTGDPDTNDTVFLNSMITFSGQDSTDGAQKMLIGHCSIDKSIRLYRENMSLLVRESGHTEGVSDVALLEQSAHSTSAPRSLFVSTGLDGTILIWNVLKSSSATAGFAHEQVVGLGPVNDEHEAAKRSPASLPPMRKVLSKIEIADLSGLNGQLSPSSARSLSPARLKRKTSRLALATSIEDVEEVPTSDVEARPRSARSPNTASLDPRRSPSPPVRAKLRSQRSRTELGRDIEQKAGATSERSPSPPAVPVPTTPKQRQMANNGRLRRAPSVPSDLRAQAMIQGRRQSMSHTSEFGSLAMATDQAARMLKIYKKKLVNSKESVDLNDLEYQVSGLLKTIRERKDRTILLQKREAEAAGQKEPVKAATPSDVDQLSILLAGSTMVDSPTKLTEGEDSAVKSA
ncbi:WD domain, G-beta repeat containing protein [Cladophialophora carrionii]|uniref:WD domain, G-beta repeat containing protein n=1 Tax=Cladophialophora carrionii TaxID=86049 RepID=A0A1C1C738_9EURO|nr:WD domain, G-beta repeat containing protein [Cladophialophora carrionii]